MRNKLNETKVSRITKSTYRPLFTNNIDHLRSSQKRDDVLTFLSRLFGTRYKPFSTLLLLAVTRRRSRHASQRSFYLVLRLSLLLAVWGEDAAMSRGKTIRVGPLCAP